MTTTTYWGDPDATWGDPNVTWGGAFVGRIPLTPGPDIGGPVIDTTFRFELLDSEENLIRTLRSVAPGGEVSWDAYGSVKGTGSFNLNDTGQDINWLNTRIRPILIRTIAGVTRENPLGVFLPAAPVENWNSSSRTWKVELADKNSILDGDVMTDANYKAITYSLPAGTNIVDAVVQIINDAGELTPAIEPDTKTLSNPVTWAPETTRLKIINDLLDAGNYFSLWVDGLGQYRIDPYVEPGDRTPFYTEATPFSHGEDSFMEPEWDLDNDISAVPNRFICMTQGDGESAALTSTAVNIDPTSPFSFQNRGDGTMEGGRWVTVFEPGIEATDQGALDAYTRRRLASATSVTRAVSLKHLYLPDLRVNSVVRFTNPHAGLDNLMSISKMTVPFDALASASSELRDVGPFVQTETP